MTKDENDQQLINPLWLKIAFNESLRFSGRQPFGNRLLMNTVKYYYHGFGAGYVQYSNWCAAFVSYCFKRGGVDFKGTACSQDFLSESGFTRLKHPVYGCISVWTKKGDARFGHVGFPIAVGKADDYSGFDKSLIVLGGNQSNTIKFSIFPGPESKTNNSNLSFSCFLFPSGLFYEPQFHPIREISKREAVARNLCVNPSPDTDFEDSTTLTTAID